MDETLELHFLFRYYIYIYIYLFCTAGWISVMWDSGAGFQYRYGAEEMFDIVVCDSPRVLVDQLIAVGCLVTRGKSNPISSSLGFKRNVLIKVF